MTIITTAATLFLLAQASSPAAALPDCGAAGAEARAVERAWLDAYEQRDAAAMGRVLAPEFAITFSDGSVQTRRQVLDGVTRRVGTPGPRFVTTEVTARCRPGVVVLSGWVADQRETPVSPERYTDTYVRAADGWQVLTSHLSAPDRDD